MVAVDKIETCILFYTIPHWVLSVMNLVPAHVRYFEFISLRIMHLTGKPHHFPMQNTQPGYITFITVLKQHLQPDADAKKRLAARSKQHGIAQSAGI